MNSVIGGFGGGPWLDGRVRLRTAIGYGEKCGSTPRWNLRQCRRAQLDAFTALIADVRAGRQIKAERGSRGHRRHPHALSARFGTTDPDVRARGLQCHGRDLVDARRLRKIKLIDHLPKKYTCILFDRRECGKSGRTGEHVTWPHYVARGKGLLDHLHRTGAPHGRLHGLLPGGGVRRGAPAGDAGMVLYWPVGGARYRISSHQRFAEHLAFVQQHGLDAVVALVAKEGKPFGADPRGGPWASVIKADPPSSATYAKQNVDAYKLIVAGMRSLFDRDTAPGTEPEDLLRLDIPAFIVPGRDAGRLGGALPGRNACHDPGVGRPVAEQTETTVAARGT